MTTADAGPRSFELETKLGCGSVGEVWRAQVDGRLVAVKLINDPANARQRHSLETELQALSCLEHPAIPALYGFDLEGERAYIIMECIAGEPFHRLIAEGGIWHILLEQRLTILDQIAGAVAHSHARGLIHRDIKPANLIGIEQPHLIDFGIAAEPGATVTPAGTPFYMFPGDQLPSPAHDAFGFALTAYELLFGVHPLFTAQDGGLARDEVCALARQRLADQQWRMPSRIAAHEVPYDLRGVDLPQIDAVFAAAFDWQAAAPLMPSELVAALRTLVLTPDNQPYREAMPQMLAPTVDHSADLPGTITLHPEAAARWEWPTMLLTSVIGVVTAIILFIALQNAF